MAVDDLGGASFEELADAFLRAPRIIPIGYRHQASGGQIAVLSHIELWLWRLVVVGCRTRTQAELDDLQPKLIRPPIRPVPAPGAQVGGLGGVTFEVHTGGGRDHGDWHAKVRADLAWYDAWTVHDDVDTAYWFAGSPRQQHARVDDFAIERHPAPPANASTLTIGTPFGDTIHISLADHDPNPVTINPAHT